MASPLEILVEHVPVHAVQNGEQQGKEHTRSTINVYSTTQTDLGSRGSFRLSWDAGGRRRWCCEEQSVLGPLDTGGDRGINVLAASALVAFSVLGKEKNYTHYSLTNPLKLTALDMLLRPRIVKS